MGKGWKGKKTKVCYLLRLALFLLGGLLVFLLFRGGGGGGSSSSGGGSGSRCSDGSDAGSTSSEDDVLNGAVILSCKGLSEKLGPEGLHSHFCGAEDLLNVFSSDGGLLVVEDEGSIGDCKFVFLFGGVVGGHLGLGLGLSKESTRCEKSKNKTIEIT